MGDTGKIVEFVQRCHRFFSARFFQSRNVTNTEQGVSGKRSGREPSENIMFDMSALNPLSRTRALKHDHNPVRTQRALRFWGSSWVLIVTGIPPPPKVEWRAAALVSLCSECEIPLFAVQ